MALVVESGAGIANADAYISLVDADLYHTDRGNAAWAALASDTVREQCIRRATDFMEQAYRLRWAGYRVSTTQALSWPRYEVPIKDSAAQLSGYRNYYASDAVPVQVARACAELALRASEGALSIDEGREVTSEKVGPIAVEYAHGASQQTEYTAVENLLEPFFAGGGSFVRLLRA